MNPTHSRTTLPLTLLGAAWFCAASWLPAAESAEKNDRPKRIPAPAMSFQGAGWLERHDREEGEKPDDVIAVMKLKDGDRVVDLGCGTGYFARRMARLVAPTGKIYGVDIQQEMLDFMKKFAERDGVTGIVPVLGDVDDPKLPKGEIDWILLVDVYHEFESPEKMLAKMRESLSPRGRVALVEYRVEDGTGDHIKPNHRMSVRQVLAEWKPAGFELLDLLEFLPTQHIFILRAAETSEKPGAPNVMPDIDLVAGLKDGSIEAEAAGSGEAEVSVRIRSKRPGGFVVTAPAGTYFKANGETRDMIARRDAAVVLPDAEWRTWKVRSVGVHQSRPAPAPQSAFTIESASDHPGLSHLMFSLQSGGVPFGAEVAAARIAIDDATFDDLNDLDDLGQINREGAITLALVYCDQSGIAIHDRRIWKDRARIVEGLKDKNLRDWIANQ